MSRRRYRWMARPDRRLLGRGVHRGGTDPHRGARRPVGLHRHPRRESYAPDARRAGHHPGRPGRHRPGRVARGPGRRRWSRHRQDGRRAAPHGVSALRRSEAGAPARWRALRGPARALPRLRRRRAAEPRGGGRADLHRPRPGAGGGPRARGRRAGRRAQGRPADGRGDRAGRGALRGAAHGVVPRRDRLGRRPDHRVRVGRGLRLPRPGNPPQPRPRRRLGRGPHDPRRQGSGRRRGPLPRRAPARPRPPRRAARHLRPGLAPDRAHRPRRRPLDGAGLPAPLRSLARARGGPGPASRRPRGVDVRRPPAARRRPAAAR